ncbi:MAG: efflux RND transporter periplasmic adaptor subunit [Gammaproteobacteria bacterium]|nr:efflux RND transporter periplasmic adaptor subunit [Gammaproteobacteria bacterium]
MNAGFKYKKIVIGVVLLIVAGASFIGWRSASHTESMYRPATIARGDIEVTTQATGVVKPRNRLEIKPPIAGRVEQVLVREGQHVTHGQVMAWMSSSERAALLDAARAKGADELKRWEELYRPTPVIAPIDGTLILRNAEPGQTFQNLDAIFVISDRLVVKAQVDETDIARVQLRQSARVTLDAYASDVLSAVVEQVAFDSTAVNNVTTYEVDVLPEKTPPFMRSGMTANVSFVVAAKHDIVLAPAEAVRGRGSKMFVLVPAADTRAPPVEREVQLGLSDGRHSEVLAGLAEGETVLIPQLTASTGGTGGSPLMPGRRR